REIAYLPLFGAVPEIAMLTETKKSSFSAAAGAYFAIGQIVGLDRLKTQISSISTAEHWDRLALLQFAGEIRAGQRYLAAKALAEARGAMDAADKGVAAAKSWAALREKELEPVRAFLEEVEQGGTPTIGKLTLAVSQIQKLTTEEL
ncbi:MAG: hypothetical protein V3S07_03850, partial [Micropepsaceae bacterium]